MNWRLDSIVEENANNPLSQLIGCRERFTALAD
jgi:hypothetical protein